MWHFPGEGKALVFLMQFIESTVCVDQKWELVENRLRNSEVVDIILYYWLSEKFRLTKILCQLLPSLEEFRSHSEQ